MAATIADFQNVSDTSVDLCTQWPVMARALQGVGAFFSAKISTGTEPDDVLHGVNLGISSQSTTFLDWRVLVDASDNFTIDENDGTDGSPSWQNRLSLPLTVSRALVSDANGGITVSATTAAEQAALNGLTASRALVSDGSGLVSAASTTSTEIGALNGLTASRNLVSDSSGLVSVLGGTREVLLTDRDYYVRTDGSDSNDGLTDSSGGAFLTWQHALDVVYGTLDLGGFDVTINIGNGTYTAAIALEAPQVGPGRVILSGDTTTPSNVVISTTSEDAINLSNEATLYLEGIKIQTTTSGHGVFVDSLAMARFIGLFETGAIALDAFSANRNGFVFIETNYTINGNQRTHWGAGDAGIIRCAGRTITVSGTPAFSGQFCSAIRLGLASVNANTFSGSATGTRYVANGNGVIRTDGGGATYFPGDAAGSTATGGQYL